MPGSCMHCEGKNEAEQKNRVGKNRRCMGFGLMARMDHLKRWYWSNGTGADGQQVQAPLNSESTDKFHSEIAGEVFESSCSALYSSPV